MIEPNQLLDRARSAVTQRRKGKPRQVDLRRAISDAYYALFHGLIQRSTDLLVGASERKDRRYLRVYRSFEHSQMKTACENHRNLLSKFGATSDSREIGKAATAFVNLKDKREQADYNPHARFARSEVLRLVREAEDALAAVERAPARDRKAFLTSLLIRVRE